MSDINDDLLNYELGDIDDHDLAVGDEDELLLSDEETEQKEAALLLDHDELLSVPKQTTKVQKSIQKTDVQHKTIKHDAVVTTTTVPNAPRINTVDSSSSSEVTTTDKTATKINRHILKRNIIDRSKILPKNDEVSSTNKEFEEKHQKMVAAVTPITPARDHEKKIVNVSPIPSKIAQVYAENDKNSIPKSPTVNIVQPVPAVPVNPIQSEKEPTNSTEINTSSQESNKSGQIYYDDQMIHDPSHVHYDGIYNAEFESYPVELETEDSDEGNERLNPKTRVEREIEVSPEGFTNHQQRPFFKKQRGAPYAGPRLVRYPLPYNPYQLHPGNENFNPQFQPQFRPQMEHPANRMIGPIPSGPNNPQIPPRMEYRGPMPYNFRPPYANELSRPLPGVPIQQLPPHGHPIRGPRPEFQPAVPPNAVPPFRPFNGNPLIRSGPIPPRFYQLRPRMQQRPHQYMPPRPLPYAGQSHPGNLIIQVPHVIPTQHNSGNVAPTGAPVIPRKVLINPNFKGGVEAATNQLMMDTLNNSHFMTVQSDAELLRQQEAFINQNRMHIEKRRHERSPDRERSYTPPRRERRAYSRERDLRKPYNSYKNIRGRRAGSREPYGEDRNVVKRRRSTSVERDIERKDRKQEPEDEETKAYRLEIEKQKSMREKILRDKEMRRRKAAEEKTKEEEKNTIEETAPKLTPIIVTEKKIISLKKKTDIAQTSVQRTIPTAKILPESKRPAESSTTTLAYVKPVVKQVPLKTIINETEYDEDELLANSPTPPPIQHQQQIHTKQQQQSLMQTTSSGTAKTGIFTNRRVILKPPLQQKVILSSPNKFNVADSDLTTAAAYKSKGIFDRLDRKIGVNEAAKRKIQRIVIKNAD